MDGGGSTTIGVTYPDQRACRWSISPSDGSQRKNSTAIFLTTGLQPTGELASYYVTPSDSILLSGAGASPLPGWTPATSHQRRRRELVGVQRRRHCGRERPLYRRGRRAALPRSPPPTAPPPAPATSPPSAPPDEITLTNEATGAAVASLNLDPGGQVDLKGLRLLPQTGPDHPGYLIIPGQRTQRWAADANGVFTAGKEMASGNLTVRRRKT